MMWLAPVGLAIWLVVYFFAPARGIFGELEHILRFAILVLTPLALYLAANPDRRGRLSRGYRLLRFLYPPCAVCVALSFVLFPSQGPLAAFLSLPWLALSLIGAADAVVRLLPRGLYPVAELAQDLGLLYWPVGAAWLVASRLGLPVGDFSGTIVLLTSIHFHFAGFTACILIGQIGRELEYDFAKSGPSRLYRCGVALVVAGIPCTAVGIAFSPAIEFFAALSVALGLALCMGLAVYRMVPRHWNKPSGPLLIMAAGSVFVSMFYAVRYATGELLGIAPVPIDRMIVVHGWWNALGLCGAGLLAVALLRLPARCAAPGIPFSRLYARGCVGRDFFERNGLADPDRQPPPTGLVDDMRSYDGAGLSVEKLSSRVRDFYEHTDRFDLHLTPHWRSGLMRLLAFVYVRWIGARIEQMNFPLKGEEPDDRAGRIGSSIFALRADADGRPGVRAWVRFYAASGKAIYAAAYASHRMAGRTYMNIAFPVPGGNITSILRLANTRDADAGGLVLSSRPDPGGPGDEGVYFANRFLPVRLPINETIVVFERNRPGADGKATGETGLAARHDMWIWGVRFLSLEYRIWPRLSPAADPDQ